MSKKMIKKQSSELAKPARRGFEEETPREDLVIPRAKLLQGLSPEVQEGSGKLGTIVNSLTKEVLPEIFVPIFKFTNWIRFNPRNTKDVNYLPEHKPGEMVWRSFDPFDERVQKEGVFGPNGERPAATKFLNFFSFFPGVPMPVIVSFANTSMRAGRNLLSLASFTPGDMFGRKYALRTKQESNDMGTYFVFTVAQAGPCEGNEFAKCEDLWNTFHSRTNDIQVHDESPDDGTTVADPNRPPF